MVTGVYSMHSEVMDKIEAFIYAYREGDASAFDALFHMYTPMILSSLARYARGEEDSDARSLANEAFHNAVLHWSSEGAASFGTYAKRCVINALKKLQIERSHEIAPAAVDVDALCSYVGIEATVIRKDAVDRIRQVVRPILSDEEYRVFLSCILGTLSVGEYGRLHDKTRKQVEMTKWRALKKLRASKELISVLTP